VEYVQYRGGSGMLAWAFHRVSGVAVAIVEDVT
jgi:succinate dehydrogenase/fumarate reductase cytochrome b subunit